MTQLGGGAVQQEGEGGLSEGQGGAEGRPCACAGRLVCMCNASEAGGSERGEAGRQAGRPHGLRMMFTEAG